MNYLKFAVPEIMSKCCYGHYLWWHFILDESDQPSFDEVAQKFGEFYR
jgi:hypothetical protein